MYLYISYKQEKHTILSGNVITAANHCAYNKGHCKQKAKWFN